MKKYNLYAIDALRIRMDGNLRYSKKNVILVAARNVNNAFSKASRALSELPGGPPGNTWKLTGHYNLMGKAIV